MALGADALIARNRVYDSLTISFKNDTVEYKDEFRIEDIVEEYTGSLRVENEPDTDKVGDYEVRFILSDEFRYKLKTSRVYEKMIHVTDTKAPLIEFKEAEVSIYKGDEYALEDNLLRVYDEADGDIKDYQIESDADFDKAGEYTVSVTAKDINGLSSTASYILKVRNRVLYGAAGYDALYNLLTNTYGYNRAAANGILANMWFECNFNPTAGDYYYGLCQWGGSRKDNLFTYCQNNGYDPSSIEGQLAFMDYELSNGYAGVKTYLKGVNDSAEGAYEAAVYFCDHYEGAASNAGRGELARDYYG